MPKRPLRTCARCGVVCDGSYCPKHKAEAEAARKAARLANHQDYNKRRDASDSFYKSWPWRKFAKRYKAEHPLCCECERQGRVTPSQLVDHIKPYKTHPELAYVASNLRPLCWACHNRIGARVGLTAEALPPVGPDEKTLHFA